MNRMSSNDMSLTSLIESLAEIRNSCDVRLLQYENENDFILNVNTVFVCLIFEKYDTIFNHLNY